VVAPIDGPLADSPDAMAYILRWASPAGKRQPKPDAALVTVQSAGDLGALKRIGDRLRKWPQARLSLLAAGDDPALLLDALSEVDGLLWPVEREGLVALASAVRDAGKTLILQATVDDATDREPAAQALLDAAESVLDEDGAVILSLRATEPEYIHAHRLLAAQAARRCIDAPIFLHIHAPQEPLLPASIALGSLLCDGIGDAVAISGPSDGPGLAFNILQAAGARIFKTDYVACPSCGRTLFDLQETTERIKERTSHLVGVKLAIMGCIVNGPGEMADADFGYVGGAPGQVNLYVGKECVQKGVPAAEADDRLIDLIKAHGKWQDADE
jgi:(E)-4-hydroxy-3-methylbut-2-enyl-diphosphate synthase